MVRAILSGEPTTGQEVTFIRGGGQITTVLASAAPVRGLSGEIVAGITTFFDVTDQKAQEQALRESEARYRMLADATFEGVTVHENGVHLDVNETFARLFGYPRSELIGTRVVDLAAPESHATIWEHVRSGSDEPYELIGIRKDGSRMQLEARGHTVQIGQRTLRVSVLHDVTARKLAAANLQASRDQLQAILASVADGIIVQAPNHHIIYANDAAASLMGFTSAQDLLASFSLDLLDTFHVLDETGHPFAYGNLPGQRVLRGEQVPPTVMRYVHRTTGEERWSLVSTRPVLDEAKQPRFVVTVLRDVTQERSAQYRSGFLADVGAILPSTLDVPSLLDQVSAIAGETLADWSLACVVDDHNHIQHLVVTHADPARAAASQQLREALLADTDQPLQRFTRSVGAWLSSAISAADLEHLLPATGHLDLVRSLGVTSAIWVPLVARGHTRGALGLYKSSPGRSFTPEDFGLVEELARRMALAVDNILLYHQAQQAIEARDHFLSTATHELRTPITAIKATAQILLRATLNDRLDLARFERSLRSLDASTNRLTRLSDDLLDVSRLRTDRLILNVTPISLEDVMKEALQRFEDLLHDEITVVTDLQRVCPIVADTDRLDQVITNLLGNAAKYSPDGGVIRVSLSPDKGGAHLQVADQGIGLTAGSEETIFEPFGRAHNAATRQIPGMGLGLFISRGIVERHGGRIWLESAGEGRGTTAHVWLPCHRENGSG